MNCNSSCSPNNCHPIKGRNFLTNDEKVEMLKEHKSNLENEVKGITQRISELEKSE